MKSKVNFKTDPLIENSVVCDDAVDYCISAQNTKGRLEKLPEQSYSRTPALFGYAEYKRMKNLPDFSLDSKNGLHLLGYFFRRRETFCFESR